jgi:hypothetical protein
VFAAAIEEAAPYLVDRDRMVWIPVRLLFQSFGEADRIDRDADVLKCLANPAPAR